MKTRGTEHLKVVDDQPSKRDRHDCAQHRESKPVSSVLAPHRITEAQELWAGPLDHKDPIGTFFVTMKRRRWRGPSERIVRKGSCHPPAGQPSGCEAGDSGL
jgi:hypothetical protein